MVQIVMFLLVETIDVGGGTIAMIDSLARFNNMTQEVEKEKDERSPLRYDAVFGIDSAGGDDCHDDGLNNWLNCSWGGNPALTDNGLMQTVFMTAVIFNSYLIGIVAEK